MSRMGLVSCALLGSVTIPGCYESWGRTSAADGGTDEAIPSTCGNGVVETGEQCDGNGPVPCEGGADDCPGLAHCTASCSWGECLSPGFGILAGPIDVSGHERIAVERTDIDWAASTYGLWWSGASTPGAPDAHANFARMDIGGGISEVHMVLPSVYPVAEVQASWNEAHEIYGIAMIGDPLGDVMANMSGADGWVLVDPGIGLGIGPGLRRIAVASSESGFMIAAGHPDGGIGISFVDSSMTEMANQMYWSRELFMSNPRVTAHAGGFVVAWQTDDPVAGTSWLTLQKTGGDGVPIGEGTAVFADLRARPPVAVVSTGDGLALLFSRQPYFDSPVLDLYFAIVRSDGTVVTEPVTVGRVKRGEPFDAALSFTGGGFGIVMAAPLDEVSGLPRTIDVVRMDEAGAMIGSYRILGGDTDRAMPSIAWDGEAWGLAYSLSDGATAGQGVEFVRVGCIPPR